MLALGIGWRLPQCRERLGMISYLREGTTTEAGYLNNLYECLEIYIENIKIINHTIFYIDNFSHINNLLFRF